MNSIQSTEPDASVARHLTSWRILAARLLITLLAWLVYVQWLQTFELTGDKLDRCLNDNSYGACKAKVSPLTGYELPLAIVTGVAGMILLRAYAFVLRVERAVGKAQQASERIPS